MIESSSAVYLTDYSGISVADDIPKSGMNSVKKVLNIKYLKILYLNAQLMKPENMIN